MSPPPFWEFFILNCPATISTRINNHTKFRFPVYPRFYKRPILNFNDSPKFCTAFKSRMRLNKGTFIRSNHTFCRKIFLLKELL